MPDLAVFRESRQYREMHRDNEQIPLSAMYTSATWYWANLPCSDLVLPENAGKVFSLVNRYMRFYRWINPCMDKLQQVLLRRHCAINYLLRNSGYMQIVEVAAGFSPRGCWFSNDPKIHYVEIDLPPVSRKKRHLLARTWRGQQVLSRCNFHIRDGDLMQFKTIDLPLQPSAIIAEGIMMYFDRQKQLSIWASIAEYLQKSGGELIFDYIPPALNRQRSLVGSWLHRLKLALFGDRSPYRYDNRSVNQLIADLHQSGFASVEVHYGDEIGKRWRLPYGDEPAGVLIFQARVFHTDSAK